VLEVNVSEKTVAAPGRLVKIENGDDGVAHKHVTSLIHLAAILVWIICDGIRLLQITPIKSSTERLSGANCAARQNLKESRLKKFGSE
jgi:hypothetical protein